MFGVDNLSETSVKLMLHCHDNVQEPEKEVAAKVCQM